MIDYNMLSIEELIAVVGALPTAAVSRDDLICALRNLREMRIRETPSTDDLLYAMKTGDCSKLAARAQ